MTSIFQAYEVSILDLYLINYRNSLLFKYLELIFHLLFYFISLIFSFQVSLLFKFFLNFYLFNLFFLLDIHSVLHLEVSLSTLNLMLHIFNYMSLMYFFNKTKLIIMSNLHYYFFQKLVTFSNFQMILLTIIFVFLNRLKN